MPTKSNLFLDFYLNLNKFWVIIIHKFAFFLLKWEIFHGKKWLQKRELSKNLNFYRFFPSKTFYDDLPFYKRIPPTFEITKINLGDNWPRIRIVLISKWNEKRIRIRRKPIRSSVWACHRHSTLFVFSQCIIMRKTKLFENERGPGSQFLTYSKEKMPVERFS